MAETCSFLVDLIYNIYYIHSCVIHCYPTLPISLCSHNGDETPKKSPRMPLLIRKLSDLLYAGLFSSALYPNRFGGPPSTLHKRCEHLPLDKPPETWRWQFTSKLLYTSTPLMPSRRVLTTQVQLYLLHNVNRRSCSVYKQNFTVQRSSVTAINPYPANV
jgi:hypothetical protein